MTTELKWGETPFDKLSREQMRVVLCQFYSALVSAHGALSMAEGADPRNPYWLVGGMGGRALGKCRQAIKPIQEEFGGDEKISRAFFRYADDLLFTADANLAVPNWAICPKCGALIGTSMGETSAAGSSCTGRRRLPCDGTLRNLEWADLRPEAQKEAT